MSLREQELLCPFCLGTIALISIPAYKIGGTANYYAFKCNKCNVQGAPNTDLQGAWASFASQPPPNPLPSYI